MSRHRADGRRHRLARIVGIYDLLQQVAPSPVVDLNRAVAVAMDTNRGPEEALRIVDDLSASGRLAGTHLLPGVRGELLVRLHRYGEAAAEFDTAGSMAANEREREVLVDKAAQARASS